MKQLISNEVGIRIRNLRISRGKSMTSLAHDCEMEYIQLSRIERGQINTTVFQLYKITQSLGVNLGVLFFEFEDEISFKANQVQMGINESKKVS